MGIEPQGDVAVDARQHSLVDLVDAGLRVDGYISGVITGIGRVGERRYRVRLYVVDAIAALEHELDVALRVRALVGVLHAHRVVCAARVPVCPCGCGQPGDGGTTLHRIDRAGDYDCDRGVSRQVRRASGIRYWRTDTVGSGSIGNVARLLTVLVGAAQANLDEIFLSTILPGA